jgi:DNA-binding CsgD family transcriptional regulator
MKSSESLHISPKTVGTHMQRVLVKLDLHSRVEAVAYAYRADLPSRASGCYACGEI